MCSCVCMNTDVHTLNMQHFLYRYPLIVRPLGLELYLTHISCYQNRLKWSVSRWQKMVEVITLQRLLSNQPPDLPQCITEIARHLRKSEACTEGTRKWRPSSHIILCTYRNVPLCPDYCPKMKTDRTGDKCITFSCMDTVNHLDWTVQQSVI